MLAGIRKYLLIFVGTLSLGLGILGTFLPVLPTTPFLLLSSYCYMRSSKRLYDWLINHRICGEYIYNYITYKAVKRQIKIMALITLWLSLTLSFLSVSSTYLRIFLFIVGICVSIHLILLKTLPEKKAGVTEIRAPKEQKKPVNT